MSRFRFLLAFALVGAAALLRAGAPFDGLAIYKPALAVTSTETVNVSNYQRVAAQAVYSDGTPTAHTVTSGAKATTSITVTDYNALDGKAATATITMPNGKNTSGAVSGAVIRINGRSYTEGVDWNLGATSTATMNSLASAINAFWEYDATASSNVVTVTAYRIGTFANAWTITSSTPAALSLGGANFSNGQPAGTLTINGVTLTEGTDFTAATSSAVTAESIETAINANSSLSGIIIATHPSAGGVVYATTTTNGAFAYNASASTGITVSDFINGAASDVSVTGDTFAKDSHGLTTGLKILLSGSNVPGGLVTGTTYYAIKATDSAYKFALTSTGAVAGLAINITSLPDSANTYTITPLSLATAAGNGFKWQASIDGTNFADLSVASVTYSAAGSTIWDFGTSNYKWIRINYTPPTSGGITLRIYLSGTLN